MEGEGFAGYRQQSAVDDGMGGDESSITCLCSDVESILLRKVFRDERFCTDKLSSKLTGTLEG